MKKSNSFSLEENMEIEGKRKRLNRRDKEPTIYKKGVRSICFSVPKSLIDNLNSTEYYERFNSTNYNVDIDDQCAVVTRRKGTDLERGEALYHMFNYMITMTIESVPGKDYVLVTLKRAELRRKYLELINKDIRDLYVILKWFLEMVENDKEFIRVKDVYSSNTLSSYNGNLDICDFEVLFGNEGTLQDLLKSYIRNPYH